MNSSKKKIMIAVVAGLVVIAAVLILVIIKIKNGSDDPADTSASVNEEKLPEKSSDTEGTITGEDITPASGSNISDPVAAGNEGSEDVDPTPADSDDETVDQNKKNETSSDIAITLGEYKGIKAEYSPLEVTDEIIAEKLKALQKENSWYVDLPEREFETEDMAIVTMNVFIDGIYQEEFSVYCIQDIIGSGLMPDFIDAEIIGKHKGEYFDIYRDYPEDYSDIPEMAGKNVRYNIELVDGFTLYVPELTDAFIREHTKYTSIDACYTDMKKDLQTEEDQKAEDEMKESVRSSLLDTCSFSGSIEDEIRKCYVQKLQEENALYTENYFMDAASYYNLVYGMNIADFQGMLMDRAEKEVKYGYILDEIVKLENLETAFPGLSKIELREKAEELIIESADITGK